MRAALSKEQLTKVVAAAMLARNAAKKHLDKTGKVLATKISEVLSFQKADGFLTADGFYGPNVFTALKFYLQKASDPSVPPFADKYKTVKVTWEAPPLAKEPDTTKPVATKASVPTPSPAPAPAPATTTVSAKVDTSKPVKKLKKTKKSKAIAKAAKKSKIPKPPAYGQELESIKPKHDAEEHVAARATGQKPKKSKPRDTEELLAAKHAVASTQAALKKVRKHLLRTDLQKQATTEHRNINKKDAFQRQVLQQLASIQSRLGGKSGATTTGERRIVGLVL